mmetsp:Transcript_53494/g.130716  ORF Transcript_53494/g.130716 Transcript_53494/m.130716 type:complete len:232 (-) Transcript_53494:197-892(-)
MSKSLLLVRKILALHPPGGLPNVCTIRLRSICPPCFSTISSACSIHLFFAASRISLRCPLMRSNSALCSSVIVVGSPVSLINNPFSISSRRSIVWLDFFMMTLFSPSSCLTSMNLFEFMMNLAMAPVLTFSTPGGGPHRCATCPRSSSPPFRCTTICSFCSYLMKGFIFLLLDDLPFMKMLQPSLRPKSEGEGLDAGQRESPRPHTGAEKKANAPPRTLWLGTTALAVAAP